MGRLNVRKFTSEGNIRYITEAEFADIAALCAGNPLYYKYSGRPAPTAAEIQAEITALPPGKSRRDKYYLGIFDRSERLEALLDLIVGWPEEDTAWIGLFMVDAALQGRGFGSRVISELLTALTNYGFRRAALSVAHGDTQAEAFWLKNGFYFYGEPLTHCGHTVRRMERIINPPEKVRTHHN